MNDNDIVVTGVGLCTAVGATAEETWANVQKGVCGIGEVTVVRTDSMMTQVGGQVKAAELADSMYPDATPEAAAVLDRCHELAAIAAKEALANAGLGDPAARPYPAERCSLVLGTLLGGFRRGEVFQRQWLDSGSIMNADARMARWDPPYSVADYVAYECDLLGLRTVPSNACAASAVALGFGLELLDEGRADVVVAGGVDPLTTLGFAGFSSLESLDTEPCAPYSRSSGLSLGEGGAFVVLERRADAVKRGAPILAVLNGYGMSADAHHATAPDPTGAGAVRAVLAALEMAGLTPDQVGYINGHGTGTPANDSVEPKAMRSVFNPLPPMSSTKSMTGHALGAAGSVEAGVTILGLRDQMLPPTVVPPGATPQEGMDIVPNEARPAQYDTALTVSFAFGGNNAALLLSTPNVGRAPTPPLRDVVLTSYGAITGNCRTAADVRAALAANRRIYDGSLTLKGGDYGPFPIADVPAPWLTKGINPAYLRKMDPLSRRTELAVAELLKARGLSRDEALKTGLLFATSSGPLTPVEAFQKAVIETGSGSAKYFPNTVMNAAPGHVGVLHQLKGPTATICAGGTGPFAVLWWAQRLIARGAADRIIVASADELTEPVIYAYASIPGYMSTDVADPFRDTGIVLAGGAAAILLEAAEVAPPDQVIGRLEGFGYGSDKSGVGTLDRDETAWARAFSGALEDAGQPVDAVMSAAVGRARIDDIEARALARAGLDQTAVYTPKKLLGQASSVSPLLSLLSGLWLAQEPAPTAFGYYDGFGPAPADPKRFLVSSFEFGGTYSALVASGA